MSIHTHTHKSPLAREHGERFKLKQLLSTHVATTVNTKARDTQSPPMKSWLLVGGCGEGSRQEQARPAM